VQERQDGRLFNDIVALKRVCGLQKETAWWLVSQLHSISDGARGIYSMSVF